MYKSTASALIAITVLLASCGQNSSSSTSSAAIAASSQAQEGQQPGLTVSIDHPTLKAQDSSPAPELGSISDGTTTAEFFTGQFIVQVDDARAEALLQTLLKRVGGQVLNEGTTAASPDGKIPARQTAFKLVNISSPATSETALVTLLTRQGVKGNVRLSSPQAAADLAFALGALKSVGLNVQLNLAGHSQSGPPYSGSSTEGRWDYYAGTTTLIPHHDSDFYWLGSTGVNVLPAWSSGYTGAGVKLAVVDTGFVPDSWEMQGYDPRNGSYDWRDPWNYNFNAATRGYNLDSGPGAENYHGEEVAALAMGAANNEYGTAGTAPGAKPLRFQVGVGAGNALSFWDACDAVTNAVAWGARVVNLSFGYFSPLGIDYTRSCLFSAIQDAYTKGVVVVAAAGNGGTAYGKGSTGSATSTFIPAGWANVISVGSTSYNGTRDPQSNYGPLVDIWAPGLDAIQGAPKPSYTCWAQNRCLDYYEASEFIGGTSYSAPMVAGGIALMIQKNSGLNRDTVLTKLRATSYKSSGDPNVDAVGRANFAAALGL